MKRRIAQMVRLQDTSRIGAGLWLLLSVLPGGLISAYSPVAGMILLMAGLWVCFETLPRWAARQLS